MISYQISAQSPDWRYTPITFNDFAPNWIHPIQNKELIGHPWGMDSLNGYYGISLNWPRVAVIEKNHLYIVYKSGVSVSKDGLYLEKINLNNGKLLSSWHYDIRKEKIVEFPKRCFINSDGQFVLVNIRSEAGLDRKQKLSVWKFDTMGLSLISHHFPSDSDTLSKELSQLNTQAIIPESKNKFRYIEAKYIRTQDSLSPSEFQIQTGFTSSILNENGHILSDTTVLPYTYKDPDLMTNVFRNNVPLQTFFKGKDTLVNLRYVYLRPDSIVASINYFDNNLNYYQTYDVSKYLSEEDGLPYYMEASDNDFFLFKGIKYTIPKTLFVDKFFYFHFNHTGRLIEKIPLIRKDGSNISNTSALKPRGEKGLLIFEGKTTPDKLNIWISDGKGNITKRRSFNFSPNDLYLFPVQSVQLENRDVLLFAIQGRRIIKDGEVKTSFVAHVIIRFSADDLGINTRVANQPSQDNSLMHLYPNPSADQITIALAKKSSGKIELVNAQGFSVLSEKIRSVTKKHLNIRKLSNGIYFVRFIPTSKSNPVLTTSFIKN